MHIDEFITQLKQEADEFRKYWLKKAKSPPKGEVWPLQMDEPEWYEQFISFMQNYPSKSRQPTIVAGEPDGPGDDGGPD